MMFDRLLEKMGYSKNSVSVSRARAVSTISPLDLNSLLSGRKYLAGSNLRLLDSIAVNNAAKTRRIEAVSSATLFVDREEERPTPVSVPATIQRHLKQVQMLLSGIERNRVLAGRAILYFYQAENRFILVPYTEIRQITINSRYRNENEYGEWRSKELDDNITLTKDNSIQIRIGGSLPPQAVAIQGCLTIASIYEASEATFKRGIYGENLLINYPGLDQQQIDEISESILKRYGGVQNIRNILPVSLPKGVEPTITTMRGSATEAPFLETYIKAAVDICRAYGVPPRMLYINDGGDTYNNVREAKNDFYIGTVSNQLNQITTDLTEGFKTLLNLREELVIRYDTSHVKGLNPTFTEMGSFIDKLTGKPIFSPNEIRNILGYDSIEGGDEVSDSYAQPTISIGATEADQRGLVERLDEYRKSKTSSDDIITRELYHLNDIYDIDVDKSSLTRSLRYIENNDIDISKLVRLIHFDALTNAGYKKFTFIPHTGSNLCEGDCLKRSKKTFLSRDRVLKMGCKCLVIPSFNTIE